MCVFKSLFEFIHNQSVRFWNLLFGHTTLSLCRMAEASVLESQMAELELRNGTESTLAPIVLDDEGEDGEDDMIRPPTPKQSLLPTAAHPSLPITIEGYVLKKCRQRGDDKPWKKRWFCLTQGTLIYHHLADKSDNPRLFLHMQNVAIESIDAPSGHGIAFRGASFTYAISVEGSSRRRDEWISALQAAQAQPPIDFAAVLLEDDQEMQRSLGGFGRVKSALASAFATSRLGRLLIKRYLDAEAKLLIATVVEFATIESGSSVGSKIEGYVFDVAARIAVIMHAQALPAGLDVPGLQDKTLDFCYQLLHHTRDRRLAEQRHKFGNGTVSQVATDKLLSSIDYVTMVWRQIIEPNVSTKVLKRYDFVVKYLFTSKQLLALLDNVEHRQRMAMIDRCLRALLETY
eukprot:m.279124 g.279124  ORF g.279124 m.279124 type:complete len:403 (-) comp17725_c0_seq1:819-2027(-)